VMTICCCRDGDGDSGVYGGDCGGEWTLVVIIVVVTGRWWW
jgi:hypothetical protein